MAQRYSLPCSCGNKLEVGISQAGEVVQCRCGQAVEVPALRHLRQLKPAAASAAAARRRRWSLVNGLLFAAGMVLCVGGLVLAGYYQWGRASYLRTEETTEWDNLAEGLAILEAMPADEAWDAWLEFRNGGLGPQFPPEYAVHRRISEAWLKVVYAALGTAAVGALLIGSALVLPAPNRKRRRQR